MSPKQLIAEREEGAKRRISLSREICVRVNGGAYASVTGF